MPESHSLPCGFYITVHVLSSGNCPNCTLYPVVTTTLQEIFKLLSTLLFYCRISEQNIAFFYFYVRFIYLFSFLFMKNQYSKLELAIWTCLNRWSIFCCSLVLQFIDCIKDVCIFNERFVYIFILKN